MVSRIDRVTIDRAEPRRVAAFWAIALGCVIRDNDGTFSICGPAGREPEIGFQQVPASKVIKNRLHLELIAAEGDWEAEVERLQELGAGSHPTL